MRVAVHNDVSPSKFIALSHVIHTESQQEKHLLITVDTQWSCSTEKWISLLLKTEIFSVDHLSAEEIRICEQKKKVLGKYDPCRAPARNSSLQKQSGKLANVNVTQCSDYLPSVQEQCDINLSRKHFVKSQVTFPTVYVTSHWSLDCCGEVIIGAIRPLNSYGRVRRSAWTCNVRCHTLRTTSSCWQAELH